MGVGIRKGNTILNLSDVDDEVSRFWKSAYNFQQLYALKFFDERPNMARKLFATYIQQPDFKDKAHEIDFIKIAQRTNWYDVLSYHIEKAQGKILDWGTAIKRLLQSYMQSKFVKENNLTMRELAEYDFVKPYIDLVTHFMSLGWEPYYYEEKDGKIKNVYL